MEQMVTICRILPDDCPYFARFLLPNTRKGRPLDLGDKLGLATNDPQFPWNLGSTHFEAQRPMPAALCWHVAFRAYLYRKNGRRILDRDLAEAYAIQQRPAQRDRLRAFLLTNASLEQIAGWLHLKVPVVWLFSELFWNVRYRLKDGIFVADLLCLDKFGEVEDGLALIQLGYRQGAAPLLKVLGLGDSSDPENTPELYDRLERSILLDATAGTDRKLYGSKLNPAGHQALSLLLARKNRAQPELDEDMRRGLAGMSMAKSINEAARKIFQPDVDRRVALQLGQMLDEAKELDAKKAPQNQNKGEKPPI
jgi:hypothetical protein